MQKFAPLEDLTSQGECPSAEDLAAYIDGVLPKDEAARITEHLASCEECYEVYAGAVRFQLDSEPIPKGEVIAFPTDRWRPVVVWTSIAALLVVGVGLGWRLLAPLPRLMTAEVTAPIPGRPEVVQESWSGPTFRGGEGEDAPDVPIDEASFQMGVQLVNLQMGLKAGDSGKAQDTVARILGLLETPILTQELQEEYKNLTGALYAGQAPSEFLDDASRLAEQSRDAFDAESLDLGQWVEAGRLAAITREPGFFERGDSRAFLRWLLWQDKVGLGKSRLDSETRGHLQEISRILGDGDLQGQDYQALRSQFDKILNAKYPE